MMEVQVREIRFDAGRPKLCVPITGRTLEEIIDQAVEAKQYAQVIEWRADYFEWIEDEEKVNEVLLALRDEIRNIPLIFNFRTEEAGGMTELSLNEYQRLVNFAAGTRLIDLVDMEVSIIERLTPSYVQWLQSQGVRVILSLYDFKGVPKEGTLLFHFNLVEHVKADIGKIVVTPTSEEEVLKQMKSVMKAQTFVELAIISTSIGRLGKFSQVAGSLDGSCMTYACVKGNPLPDAQIDAQTLALFLDELK